MRHSLSGVYRRDWTNLRQMPLTPFADQTNDWEEASTLARQPILHLQRKPLVIPALHHADVKQGLQLPAQDPRSNFHCAYRPSKKPLTYFPISAPSIF